MRFIMFVHEVLDAFATCVCVDKYCSMALCSDVMLPNPCMTFYSRLILLLDILSVNAIGLYIWPFVNHYLSICSIVLVSVVFNLSPFDMHNVSTIN